MTEETFVRELERRADTVHPAPLSFDDVRGKARSIRRRRRGAVAGGVAAAVALVVLVPTVLTGGTDPRSDAPEPAPPPSGHAAVLHDGTLTRPDGTTVPIDLDNEAVTQLGFITDGRLVAATQDPYAVLVFAPDGTLQEQYEVQSNAITMSADDSMVAWIGGARTGDRGVRLLLSGVAEPDVFPGIPAVGEFPGSVSAVLDPTRLLVDGGNGTDAILRPGGTEPSGLDESVTVSDVSPDGSLWAIDLAPDPNEQFGCAALYDPAAGEVVAQNCDTSNLEFSPDGEHLVGARGDNAMLGDARILDRDLEEVGRWEPGTDGDVLKSVAWEDADHLVVSEANWQDNTWSLSRVDLTWSDREVLDGPVEGGNPEVVDEFLLSE